jgi:hypothetical protein
MFVLRGLVAKAYDTNIRFKHQVYSVSGYRMTFAVNSYECALANIGWVHRPPQMCMQFKSSQFWGQSCAALRAMAMHGVSQPVHSCGARPGAVPISAC